MSYESIEADIHQLQADVADAGADMAKRITETFEGSADDAGAALDKLVEESDPDGDLDEPVVEDTNVGAAPWTDQELADRTMARMMGKDPDDVD